MALFDYAENTTANIPTSTQQGYISTIKSDFMNTYNTICAAHGGCPSDSNDANVSPFDNQWFDDMGWWEQALLNAYEFTNLSRYLHAAEQLWNNVTDDGVDGTCNLIVQEGVDDSGIDDGFANSLYVRDSAWLYAITNANNASWSAQYMAGESGGKGGALRVANSVMSQMIFPVAGTPAPGTSGAEFFIAGQADPGSPCTASGTRYWLSTQGEMVNGFADLSVADATYCPVTISGVCTARSSYYGALADELATTITTNTNLSSPPTVDGSPPILTEPCVSQDDMWPTDCNVKPGSGNGINDWNSNLIFKGNFERGAYCSLHNVGDPDLRVFIKNNADAIAAEPHDGFLWEPGSDNNVSYGTRASMLDGLEAYIGGSTAMCAGGS
jgi:hypothetical protein